MLDDGRLTDGQGRTVDFKNTLIIMTSNIGSPHHPGILLRRAPPPPAEDHARMEELVRAELKQHFRPEFLNRIDDIIIFHSLDEKQICRHRGNPVAATRKRAWPGNNWPSTLDAAATRYLAKEGYDPQFGARPLKRALQEHLLNPLAMKLLSGEFKSGDAIKVTAAAGALKFQPVK